MSQITQKIVAAANAIGILAAGTLVSGAGSVTSGAGLFVTAVAAQTAENRCLPSSKFTNASASWKAAAPGRIEPRNGEFRIWAPTVGRISEFTVGVGAIVEADQLVAKLDDEETRANLAAAEAEAASAKHAQDQAVSSLNRERQEVRDADDQVYQAEREVLSMRLAMDGVQSKADHTDADLADIRKQYDGAKARLEKASRSLGSALGKRLAEPNQIEAAVQKARAMVAIARAQFEKTRIRVKTAGTVLAIESKAGEIVSPSLESLPLMIVGDIQRLRLVAEVDEADARNIKAGGTAFICAPSDPGRAFEGKVVQVALTLSPPRLSRGPLRPTDIEVLLVWVELEAPGTLKPGMRAEVFFQ